MARVNDGKRLLLTWYSPDAYAFSIICWEPVMILQSTFLDWTLCFAQL